MGLDWNGPRLVLAIKRAGNLTEAAGALEINHSTAFRRLATLEEKLATRLFERLPGGVYRPTEMGERMASAAERMEYETLALEREIEGSDFRLTGRLRVTSPETLAYRILIPHMANFRVTHPGIVVEHVVDNRLFDLSRREADIAVRPIRPTEAYLWGRKLANVPWAVYGSRACLEARGFPKPDGTNIGRYDLIGWDESARRFGAADWLENIAADAIVYRTASLLHQMVAAKAGIGLAVLPCYFGDPEPELARALPRPVAEIADELWIVTHAELKNTARVRAFFEVVGMGLARDRYLA